MPIATLLVLSIAGSTSPAVGPLRLSLGLALDSSSTAPPQASADAPLSFELLPPEARSPEELAKADALQRVIDRRRKLLELHQGFGIATAALLAATVVVGQLSYSDKFGGGNTGKYELAHGLLEAGATASFASAGLLALFAPVPFEKGQSGLGSITIHKWAMITATAGYAAELVLGVLTVSREGHLNQQSIAEAHLVTGYVTAAAEATGVGALFLP